MTKFLNISTDNTLGGNSPSDVAVSSQKAVKEYVDSQTGTAPAFANITGQPTDNTNLASALNAKYDASNPNGYTSNVGTVTSVNNVSPVNGNVTISIPSEVTESTVSGWGFTKNTGTVTSANSVSPVNGNVTLSIPAAQVNSDWNAVSGVTQILNKPNLATVATSGSYNDLSNKPTIPTVNNATLTLTQGGTTKGTFTANASSNVTIDLDSGGSVDVDNKSITTNASDQIQAIGVINSRDSSTAVKTWTGTKAQYDAIVTKDPNTLYNITDDTDVSLTILEALYPVGSVYITTANTCPLSTLISGSTWVLVSSGIVKAGNIPCKGNGMTLGLTDGTDLFGINTWGSSTGLDGMSSLYGQPIGTSSSQGRINSQEAAGITTDSTKSGIIADTSSLTLSVNIFERTA